MTKADNQNKPNPEDSSKWKKFTDHEQGGEKPEKADEHDDHLAEQTSNEELYNLGIEFPSRDDLESQLTQMEKKVDEYKAQALRAQAELDNVRKRAERDVSNAHKFGTEKLLNELLPVLDSLVRGIEGTPETNEVLAQARKGMQLTLELMEKTLAKFGVQIIEPESGEPFDPTKHEAVGAQPNPDFKSGSVIQVLQRGYELNGRILRAAMVMVAQ